MRNIENPFKFGTIVEENYFTDRVEEVAYIEQFMKRANHLVLISSEQGTVLCSFKFLVSCAVLLTTLFGELDLNPYFCNRQNYTYESSFNKQHSEKEKQNGHLPCGFGQESKTCPCDLWNQKPVPVILLYI